MVMQDTAGTPLEIGDLVMDVKGRPWIIAPVPPSVLLYGHCVGAVPPGKPETPVMYMRIRLIVKVTPEELEGDRAELWLTKSAPYREDNKAALKARRAHLDKILLDRGLRKINP